MPSIPIPESFEHFRQEIDRLPRLPDGSIAMPPELLTQLVELAGAGGADRVPGRPAKAHNGGLREAPLEDLQAKSHSRSASSLEGVPVLEAVYDAVVATDADLTITSWNRAAEKLYGWTAEEALGQPVTRMIPTEWTPEQAQAAQAELMEGGVFVGSMVQSTRDGRKLWVECHGKALRDAEDALVGYVSLNHDITEQKLSEEALRQSEERFRTSVDTMLDGFAIYSAVRDRASGKIVDFCYEYINEAGCQMNRRRREATVGHTLLKLLPAHRETGIFDEYVQVVETGRPLVRENLVYEDVFGVERLRRVFDHRAVKLGDGFALAWRDVTARHQAEEALRLNEARFRIALQDAPISVATHDRELRYTWVYLPQIGFSPEKMLGKRDDELLPPQDVAELVALKQAVLDTGQGVHQEAHLHTRHGWRLVVLHAEPILAASGEVEGVRTAAFDITEQRVLEEAVLQNQTRLEVQRRLTEQREQERLQIARDLHDGPLQTLSLLTVDLKEAAKLARDKHPAAALQAAIDTVRGLIQELRQFTTELRPPLLKFGLPRAIAAHANGFKAKNPGLQLHLEVQQETPPLSETIRLTLYRIYQEALSNILKHAQATEVWIRFGVEDHTAWMEIRDNGAGFTLPGQWLDLARAGHLGLVGMRERAEAMGGSLQIHSRPGQGTTLLVKVPVKE